MRILLITAAFIIASAAIAVAALAEKMDRRLIVQLAIALAISALALAAAERPQKTRDDRLPVQVD